MHGSVEKLALVHAGHVELRLCPETALSTSTGRIIVFI